MFWHSFRILTDGKLLHEKLLPEIIQDNFQHFKNCLQLPTIIQNVTIQILPRTSPTLDSLDLWIQVLHGVMYKLISLLYSYKLKFMSSNLLSHCINCRKILEKVCEAFQNYQCHIYEVWKNELLIPLIPVKLCRVLYWGHRKKSLGLTFP
jgi:hypothetical protein